MTLINNLTNLTNEELKDPEALASAVNSAVKEIKDKKIETRPCYTFFVSTYDIDGNGKSIECISHHDHFNL